MDENILNESFDKTFIQLNNLGNSNENYTSSHKFNLFQQFFIIGLEPKVIYNINKVQLSNYPKKFLEPVIISKYPNISFPYLCIPDNIIISHCFPNGFVDIIEDENNLKIKEGNFIFSLDNQGYEEKDNSLRTKKVYYTCYYFYENIEDYRLFVNLRESNLKNKNNSFNKNCYIKKVLCLSSFHPIYKESQIILKNLKKYIENYSLNNKNEKIEINKNNYIPIEKIIEGLIYNIPSLPKSNFTIKINNETFNFDNNDEIIFKEKTINKLPMSRFDFENLLFFFTVEEILEIIKWILLEVPILFFCENLKDLTNTIESFSSLIYPFEYSYPIISILPEENYSLISIMKHFIFGINYKYSQEILIKKGINIQNLDMVIIIKIEKKYNDFLNIKERSKKNNNSQIIILNSDDTKPILKLNQIYSHYNNKEKSEESKKQNVLLPLNPKEKITKKFFEVVESRVATTKKIPDKQENDKSISDELNEVIFNLFLYILIHYQEYCLKLKKKEQKDINIKELPEFCEIYEKDDIIEQKYIENKIEIDDIFKVNDFINNTPQDDKLFYTFFLNSKIFFHFMMKKIFPNSLQDKLEILFFDEKINEKLAESGNKQYISPFLKCEFNDIKGDITLSNFRKKITQDYEEFLLNAKNQKRGYNYFQYISEISDNIAINNIEIKNSIDIENQNKISFNYTVFPKLLNDDIFYKDDMKIEKFWDPERSKFTSSNSNCIYNHFEKQGKLLLYKKEIIKTYDKYNYSFDLLSSFSYKIKDCIHLLWLQYFAKTFHYTKISERKKEFDKMMIVLNNLKIVDKNTLNILFLVIYKHGDINMFQTLFTFLKNNSYISYLALREKTKIQNNFLKYNYKNDIIEEEKNEAIIIKNKISFYEISFCENKLCKQSYNVQEKFIINESINNKINLIKFKCEKCQKEQNILIRAIYNNGKGKQFNINFNLISPLALLKRKWFQDKLDLDLHYVIKEHFEPYMSALFYFHLQDIYHEFMIPPEKNNDIFSISNNSYLSIEKNNSINDGYKNAQNNFNNDKKDINMNNICLDLSNLNIRNNQLSSDLNIDDFDIPDNNMSMLESDKNIDNKEKEDNEIKNKTKNKKVIIKHSVEEFQQKNNNTFEFFSNINKKNK